MEKGDYAKYLPTSTVGMVEDVKEEGGRVWIRLDRTGLYYASETLTPADAKEYRARSVKERGPKSKGPASRKSIEDLDEMEREVDIDELMPSGGGRALPAAGDRGAPPSKERGAPDPETPYPAFASGILPPYGTGRPCAAPPISAAGIPFADARRRLLRAPGAEYGEVRERHSRAGGGPFWGPGFRKAVA